MDNGVHITNREIFDAVQEVSRKLDDHVSRHEERDKIEVGLAEKSRSWWQTRAMWAAVSVSLVFGIIGVVPK